MSPKETTMTDTNHLCPACLGQAELGGSLVSRVHYSCPRCYQQTGLRGHGRNPRSAGFAWDFEVELYTDGVDEAQGWARQYCDEPELDPQGADAIELPAGWT